MAAPLQVFGSAPAGLTAFDESGPGGDDFTPIEHVGETLIVSVHGPQEVTTRYGLKTAIKCDVVALGAKGPQTYSDVLIFSAAIVSQLKDRAGQKIVALVETYDTQQGGKAPRLASPTPEGTAAAEAYEKG